MKTATQIRERILEVVLKKGGHLASSLGAVELSMALAKVFNPEVDRVVWDVGHQAYAWKILTGRDESFDSLRQFGGVAPFPTPAESRADAAVAGHAGSALAVALGLAAARDRRHGSEHVVAVIGDGSIVNGHSFEALNNCAAATRKIIVILNDNDMAISKPAGSFARFLGRLITGVRYNRVKAAAEAAGHKMRLTFLRGLYHKIESRVKGLFLGNRFFEEFGLRYLGPVDGHDLAALEAAFSVARDDKASVLVHVVTQKGKGYRPAERNPTLYHGFSPNADSAPRGRSWSEAFSEALTEAARRDERLVALTAGMLDGTSLVSFQKEFPSRCFDVGIAEGCMVGLAAGLAAGGLKPVVAVYSTFLQRAIDQVIHDVALPNVPVILCVDRAGLVGADGATHQGLYDIALLRTIPNVTICQPCDEDDLKRLFNEALLRSGPTVIRYPRGLCPRVVSDDSFAGKKAVQLLNPDAKIQLWATGDYVARALEVARQAGCGVVYARSLKPFDESLLAAQREAGATIVSLENGAVQGGFGEALGADVKLGWPDTFIAHGSVAQWEAACGLDAPSILQKILSLSKEG